MADQVENTIKTPTAVVAFAVPASTVDGVNTYPYDIVLLVTTAGTLTVIKLGVPGATTTVVGTTLPQQIYLPAGMAINLTYSVAPAWTAIVVD